MPSEGGKMVALLGAVKDEVAGVREHMDAHESIPGRGWHLFKGQYGNKDVLLVQTGMGRANAENATHFILEHYPVTTLVALGFAGALCQELEVGDVVLCRKLHCESDSAGAAPCYSDHRLMPLAAHAMEGEAVKMFLGSSVTVSRLVTDPEQKQALGMTFKAKAVDMESYWVAKLACARHIPFLAVHAISDTVMESLPPFDQFFGSHGEWLWQKALGHFLGHPGELAKLTWVYRNTRQARKSLTGFLDALVPRL